MENLLFLGVPILKHFRVINNDIFYVITARTTFFVIGVHDRQTGNFSGMFFFFSTIDKSPQICFI